MVSVALINIEPTYVVLRGLRSVEGKRVFVGVYGWILQGREAALKIYSFKPLHVLNPLRILMNPGQPGLNLVTKGTGTNPEYPPSKPAT